MVKNFPGSSVQLSGINAKEVGSSYQSKGKTDEVLAFNFFKYSQTVHFVLTRDILRILGFVLVAFVVVEFFWIAVNFF